MNTLQPKQLVESLLRKVGIVGSNLTLSVLVHIKFMENIAIACRCNKAKNKQTKRFVDFCPTLES